MDYDRSHTYLIRKEQMDSPQIPENCDLCPNRKTPETEALAKVRGKWVSYTIALVLTGLIVVLCMERKGGSWESRDNPPLPMVACLAGLVCTLLGVQISPETIGKLGGR